MSIICADPGHGGSDSGATGFGVRECDIALAITLKLRDLLEKGGHTVLLTRETDVDVAYPNASATEELQARAEVANQNNADLFLSIHLNAVENAEANGTETFCFTGSGEGQRLADCIHRHILALGFTDRNVKEANFAVLRYTNMTAVLIETGFISNQCDNVYLKEDWGQTYMTQAIFEGIKEFLG